MIRLRGPLHDVALPTGDRFVLLVQLFFLIAEFSPHIIDPLLSSDCVLDDLSGSADFIRIRASFVVLLLKRRRIAILHLLV